MYASRPVCESRFVNAGTVPAVTCEQQSICVYLTQLSPGINHLHNNLRILDFGCSCNAMSCKRLRCYGHVCRTLVSVLPKLFMYVQRFSKKTVMGSLGLFRMMLWSLICAQLNLKCCRHDAQKQVCLESSDLHCIYLSLMGKHAFLFILLTLCDYYCSCRCGGAGGVIKQLFLRCGIWAIPSSPCWAFRQRCVLMTG